MGCMLGCCYKTCCHKQQQYLTRDDLGKGKNDNQTDLLELPSGRIIAYVARGPTSPINGTVIFLHGHPGTRLEVQCSIMDEHLERESMRLITFDRPGSGFSHHVPGYTVGDIVPDILALADHLQIKTFVVGGGSGGGPFVVAAAALLPRNRLLGVFTTGGCAAFDAVTPADMMYLHNPYKDGFEEAAGIPLKIDAMFQMSENKFRGMLVLDAFSMSKINPETVAAKTIMDAFKTCPIDGEALVNHRPFLGSLVKTVMETPRSGLDGIYQEHQMYKNYDGWGFKVEDVPTGTRALIINGSVDVQVPLSHARWYVNRMRGSKLLIIPGHGHVSWWIMHPDFFLACARCVMSEEEYKNVPAWAGDMLRVREEKV